MIYLVILFIAWFVQDSQLDKELDIKLEKEYVMHKGLNNIPEFHLMGINAQYDSVIPAYGKTKYYQGWSEYYAYLHGALELMMEQIREDIFIDEKLVSDVQSVLKSWDQIYFVDLPSDPTQRQDSSQMSFDQQIDHLITSHEPQLKKLKSRQLIYRNALIQEPRILYDFGNEIQVAHTLKVLHLMSLDHMLKSSISQQAKLNELHQYFNDLQRWYAKCTHQEMCKFYLNALSDTLDLIVLQVNPETSVKQIDIQPISPLHSILERLYLNETATLRLTLHMIASPELYKKGDQLAEENPDMIDSKSRHLLKWVVQPMMRILVLHNDSANFYWHKHKTMLDLSELAPDEITAHGPIKYDIPNKFYTPKNLIGKISAWLTDDMEYTVVAHHKVLQKIELINLWQSNGYKLKFEAWKNKPSYIFKNNHNQICRSNPIFEYFLAYEVQVRPQCIGEIGIINQEKNPFNFIDSFKNILDEKD